MWFLVLPSGPASFQVTTVSTPVAARAGPVSMEAMRPLAMLAPRMKP